MNTINLPDCVTSNILCRIPTIEALRTCVLSRDWKHKWTCIYDIDINDIDDIEDTEEYFSREVFDWEARTACFYSFVDKVLDANRDLSVRNVCFDLGAISHDSHHIGTWISRVVSLRVKNLSVVALKTQHSIVLPKILECSTTLTELKLALDCTLQVRILDCFPKLESLYLSGGSDGRVRIINMQSPISGKLLLSLALLKNLELERFDFMNAKSVEIDSPELVNFKASSAGNPYDYVVKIYAPKLARVVTARGPVFEFVQCILSVCDMDLSIGVAMRKWQVTDLLNGAPNLKCLRLASESTVALATWKGIRVLPTLNQLKRLDLSGASANLLCGFLQATPYLESLVLSIAYDYWFTQLQEPLPDVSTERSNIYRL